jgi:hypothetical protein
MTVHPVRYNGESLAWKSWLPTIPEQLADMMNMAMRIERSPGERALRASQDPLTASSSDSEFCLQEEQKNLRHGLEKAILRVRIAYFVVLSVDPDFARIKSPS